MHGEAQSARLAASLLVHVGRAATGAGGLTAAQWSALRYFAHAHPLSCTPSAFARFHGATRGTASQTIKSLVAAGLLAGCRDPSDGRSVRFALTPRGRERLRADPVRRLEAALAALPGERAAEIAQALTALAADLARLRGCPGFGACPACAHLDEAGGPEGARCCRRLGIPLGPADLERLCAHFTPRQHPAA